MVNPRGEFRSHYPYTSAVQATSARWSPERLCRPGLRKASGFPADAAPLLPLRAGWKAQPSSLRGGDCLRRASLGKAKPFRKSGGGAAGRIPLPADVHHRAVRLNKIWLIDAVAGLFLFNRIEEEALEVAVHCSIANQMPHVMLLHRE